MHPAVSSGGVAAVDEHTFEVGDVLQAGKLAAEARRDVDDNRIGPVGDGRAPGDLLLAAVEAAVAVLVPVPVFERVAETLPVDIEGPDGVILATEPTL